MNLFELSSLQRWAGKTVLYNEAPKKNYIKDKPKQAENYLICREGIVAETDQTGLKDGWSAVKE